MSNSKELRDGVVEDGARWLDGGKCSFVGLESVGKPFLHKSRGRLICKIFLLGKWER